MKELLLYHHLGLGDHIICCGLVRHFARLHPHVFVLCKEHNCPSVKWMFADLKNLTVVDVLDDYHADRIVRMPQMTVGNRCDIMRLTASGHGFDRQFYSQAGVPFEERWSGFHVERAPQQHYVPLGPFCLIHDDHLRGFKIADPQGPNIIRVTYDPDTPNIFQWQAILEMAAVIHCIPSSFAILADSLTLRPDVKLFLHGSARPGWDQHTTRYNWEIV